MSRMKTFFKYALWVILFFIFSNVMINIGINTTYKDMEEKNKLEQVHITVAQATNVNGRIKGTIQNTNDEKINGKYLEISIYSERNIFLGNKYIEIQNLNNEQTQEFAIYFKTHYAKYYKLSIVEEKQEDNVNIEFLQADLSKPEIWFAAIVMMLILW